MVAQHEARCATLNQSSAAVDARGRPFVFEMANCEFHVLDVYCAILVHLLIIPLQLLSLSVNHYDIQPDRIYVSSHLSGPVVCCTWPLVLTFHAFHAFHVILKYCCNPAVKL